MKQKHEHNGKRTRQINQGAAGQYSKNRSHSKKQEPKSVSTDDWFLTFIPQGNLRLTAWQSLFICGVIASIYLPEIQAAQLQIEGRSPADPVNPPALTNSTFPVRQKTTTQSNPSFFFPKTLQLSSVTLAEPYQQNIKRKPAKPNFYGIPAVDVASVMGECTPAYMIFSEKICRIDGKNWSMTVLDEKKKDTLRLYYNRRFTNECMGIRTPEARYFSQRQYGLWNDERKIFFASEQIPGYVPGRDFLQSTQGVFGYKMPLVQQKLLEIVRESGLVNILVAASFLGSVTINDIGADGQGLVLMAADWQPESIDDYLRGTCIVGESLLSMSLNNVRDMYALYQTMKSKSPPQVHELVDMTEERYHTLLAIYSDVCKEVQLKGLYKGMDPQVPSFEVNRLWTAAFRERAEDILSWDQRSTSCYNG